MGPRAHTEACRKLDDDEKGTLMDHYVAMHILFDSRNVTLNTNLSNPQPCLWRDLPLISHWPPTLIMWRANRSAMAWQPLCMPKTRPRVPNESSSSPGECDGGG